MSVYPIVRYVTAPDASARVLFDFQNPGSHDYPHTYVTRDDFSMGEPSLSGDPKAIGRVYGTRTPQLKIRVRGEESDTLRVLSALAREMVRPRSWLMFQKSKDTRPVFFRTYATNPGRLNFEDAHNLPTEPQEWSATVPLLADAFVLGPRVRLSVVALGNDPVSGGCFYRLPPILGDAPTPLTISAHPDPAAGNWGMRRVLASVFSVTPDADGAGPVIWEAGDMDPLGGAGAATTGAAWFGKGYREVTFSGGNAMYSRLLAPLAGLPALRPGRYLVFARAGVTDSSTVVDLQWMTNGPVVRFDPPAFASFIGWVPLGEITTPFGVDLESLSIDDVAATNEGRLRAGRVSGTGALRVNGIAFLPVEMVGSAGTTTLNTHWSLPQPTTDRYVWDGQAESVRRLDAAGRVASSIDHTLMGAFPVAVPGEDNVLSLLTQTATEFTPTAVDPANSDRLTDVTTLDISYPPRYLWLAGDQ